MVVVMEVAVDMVVARAEVAGLAREEAAGRGMVEVAVEVQSRLRQRAPRATSGNAFPSAAGAHSRGSEARGVSYNHTATPEARDARIIQYVLRRALRLIQLWIDILQDTCAAIVFLS